MFTLRFCDDLGNYEVVSAERYSVNKNEKGESLVSVYRTTATEVGVDYLISKSPKGYPICYVTNQNSRTIDKINSPEEE